MCVSECVCVYLQVTHHLLPLGKDNEVGECSGYGSTRQRPRHWSFGDRKRSLKEVQRGAGENEEGAFGTPEGLREKRR